MKTILILSGWTRGLGEGILRAYAEHSSGSLGCIAIARTRNPALEEELSPQLRGFESILCDMGDPQELEKLGPALDRAYRRLVSAGGQPEEIILINNAGVLGPVETLAQGCDHSQFREQGERAFRINCLAPAIISGWFLARFQNLEISRKLILGMSSGASQSPMSGAAVYSMTKAGMNMLSLALASEQGDSPWPVQCIALSPGMVESDMQETLRAQTSAHFPQVEYFRSAQREGKVKNALEIGRLIASRDFWSFENGSYHHIRELTGEG